jgi:signal transduction histidine kinase/DNA-binding response OmpR family regulator
LRYAYRLKGFDTAWIETGSESRHATYTNVPAGDYVLRIKAGNGRGGWSENTAFVRLNILPPWWQTWWAYGLYIFAFVLALFTYIRVRTIGLKERAEVLERTVAERTAQITEHERHIQHQAEDLEELLHLKEKLITNISHEFRTPLTLIHGPVKRMLKSTKSQENISQLKLIRRNSRRLLRLVDQLLGLARLGSEEPLPRSSQPLTSVARAIADSFQVLAEDKGLKLTFDTAEDLWVVCSPDALDKILLNLLSNAIKFTPAGGCVSVSTRPSDDGMVELAVRDTGVGIPNEEQEVVFERFHRVDDCGESVPGAGIGLALVKELVTAYEGHIDLDSTPGEGTTVFVYLPQCQLVPESRDVKQNIPAIELSEAVELEAESLTATSGTIAVLATDPEIDAKPSILIVEDNGDMQKYLYELLSDSYHCDLAGDGQQALEKAFENIPDLVLLDVMLPKLNGFQVSHVLKEDERTSHIPIVMLTALGDRESRKVGWHEKVDGYFSKPFDDEELKLRISNLLEIRDILKSRYSSQFFDESRPVQVLNEKENGFMKKLDKVLESNHAEPEFGLSQMAENMHMSTRQLQRKLKAITGHNPAEFLRSYRLRKARELLRSGTQVGIAADAVGFSSPAYFTSCFKAQFAQTPTDYQQGFH